MNKFFRRFAFWLRHRQAQDDLAEEMEFHRATRQRALETRRPVAGRCAGGERAAPWATSRSRAKMRVASGSLRGSRACGRTSAYAVRVLWREPGFALLAIGALTAGIGLNSSLFTVYTALAMKPWAVREPDRVVRMSNNSMFDLRKRAGGQPSGFAQAELDYFAAHATTISGAVTIGRRVTVRVGDADIEASWVGGELFHRAGRRHGGGPRVCR